MISSTMKCIHCNCYSFFLQSNYYVKFYNFNFSAFYSHHLFFNIEYCSSLMYIVARPNTLGWFCLCETHIVVGEAGDKTQMRNNV